MGLACSRLLVHPCTATDAPEDADIVEDNHPSFPSEINNLEDGESYASSSYQAARAPTERLATGSQQYAVHTCQGGGAANTGGSSARSAGCLACGMQGCGLCRVLPEGKTCDSNETGQLFREALMEDLLHPLLVAPKGWPLSQLLYHAVECKRAVANSSKEEQQRLLRLFFDGATRPHTHSMCTVVLHSQTMQVSIEPRALTSDSSTSSLPDIWQATTRQKAASQGTPLAPGVAWHHICVGQGPRHPERSGASTEVRAHVAAPGNPRQLGSILGVFRSVLAAISCSAGGSVQLHDAFATLIPRTMRVLEHLLRVEETDYKVSEAACGVQQHRIRTQWNLEGIGKQFGSHQQHLWQGRPTYRLRVEGPQGDREWVAISVTETRNFRVEVTFYTTASGHLVWSRSDGALRLLQDGRPAIVPNLLGSTFMVYVEHLRLPIGTCGCSGAVDLPSMIFSLIATQEQYPIISIRCTNIGRFPMEWFYAPLFDGTLMRMLLVRCFATEVHFNEDEVHIHLSIQIPLLSSLLKAALKVFSYKIAEIIFSTVDSDPIVVLTEAFARDAEALEQLLVQ